MQSLQILKRKSGNEGCNNFEISESIIEFLTGLKSEEIILISVVSDNDQINNQLIG